MTKIEMPVDGVREAEAAASEDQLALDGAAICEAGIGPLIREGRLPSCPVALGITLTMYFGGSVLDAYGELFDWVLVRGDDPDPRVLIGAADRFWRVLEAKAPMVGAAGARVDDVRDGLLRVADAFEDEAVQASDPRNFDHFMIFADRSRDMADRLGGGGPVPAVPIACCALLAEPMSTGRGPAYRLYRSLAAAAADSERALTAEYGHGCHVPDTPEMRADLTSLLIEHDGELTATHGRDKASKDDEDGWDG